MPSQRIISCIGVSEEDTAHVRLLLRVARTRVRDNWVFGPESRADLVLADTRRVVGETALRRAAQRGVAGASIIDAGAAAPPGLHLRKPFNRDAFAMLLGKIEGGAGYAPEPENWEDDTVEFDLGHVDLSVLEADHPGAHRGYGPQVHAGEKRADLEPTGHVDLSADLAGLPVAGIAGAGTPSNPATEHGAPDGREEPPPSIEEEPLPRPTIDPDAVFPFAHYLQRGILPGPSRIALPHRQPLVIDADAQLFWAQGIMPIFEPYAREPLRYGDWEAVDRSELDKLRRVTAGRPFARLIWMDAFIHSNGFLAKHFDAGGTFRLSNRLDFILDYPNAFRVAACLTAPRKLHEVARASAVGLEEVFDIINAYEALGYVECTRR